MDINVRLATIGLALIFSASAAAQESAPPPLPIEESYTVQLPEPTSHWLVVETVAGLTGVRFYDGDSGDMMGMVHMAQGGHASNDPLGQNHYVAETIWTRGNRGERQDLLTVRDLRTLDIVREIALPGRLLVGSRKNMTSVSSDGKYAYVYDMAPLTAIHVVDLVSGEIAGQMEVPGCSLSAAIGANQTLSLCSDGTLALARFEAGTGSMVSSDPFFSAMNDPVFDNFPIKADWDSVTFLSYTGQVTQATIGDGVELSETWSLQEAVGMPPATTLPQLPSWYPGGLQPYAVHQSSGRMFVLMHMGEYWSQKEPGEELWVVDLASRRVIDRQRLEVPVESITITQDDEPLLFLQGGGGIVVMDGLTFQPLRQFEAPGGLLSVFDN